MNTHLDIDGDPIEIACRVQEGGGVFVTIDSVGVNNVSSATARAIAADLIEAANLLDRWNDEAAGRPIDHAGHVPDETFRDRLRRIRQDDHFAAEVEHALGEPRRPAGAIPKFSDDPLVDLRCALAYFEGRFMAQLEALTRALRDAGHLPAGKGVQSTDTPGDE